MADGISLGLFLCKIGRKLEPKKGGGGVWEGGDCSLHNESAEGRLASTRTLENKDDCSRLAAVLITVHRQDWSALLDNHYCY